MLHPRLGHEPEAYDSYMYVDFSLLCDDGLPVLEGLDRTRPGGMATAAL
jgi:hypothetical protein